MKIVPSTAKYPVREKMCLVTLFFFSFDSFKSESKQVPNIAFGFYVYRAFQIISLLLLFFNCNFLIKETIISYILDFVDCISEALFNLIFCFNLMKFRFEYLQRSSKSGAVYFVWFYSREHTFSVISPFWIFRLLFGFGYYLSVHYKVPNQLFNHGFCSYC